MPRDLDLLQVEMLQTDLGGCLVTTPEQTVLDVAHLRRAGDMHDDARAAILTLLPNCEPALLEDIAATQRLGRVLTFVRQLERTK